MNAKALTKANIRKRVSRQRAALSAAWVDENSRKVAERYMALRAFRRAETVCVYVALPGEVRLDGVMERCWETGKRVLAPAFLQETDTYGFKALTPDTTLVAGPWNVFEPEGDTWAEVDAAACISVPGLAFDAVGRRVGHGKGIYDRLLADAAGKTDVTKVGVCFDFQRVENVPASAWDMGMDIVVSESCAVDCGRGRVIDTGVCDDADGCDLRTQ